MITQAEMQQIVEAIERIVENKGEQLRQEFYGAIQQLIHNQQALADMLATHNNPDTMTVLAHEMWQRAVIAESERIQNQLNAAWDEMKPAVEKVVEDVVIPDPELQRILDEEEEIERQAREANPLIPTGPTPEWYTSCPTCGSKHQSTYGQIRFQGALRPCNDRWHSGT